MSLRELLVDELIRLRMATKMAKGGRRPIFGGFFRQQLGENIQERVEEEEEPQRYQEPETIQRQPIRQQIVRRPATLEIPRVPLPKMIEERITQRRFLPIRGSVARVLDSYSQYISTSPKRQREDYESYDTTTRYSEIPDDIRRKKALKPHSSIEM